MVCWMGHGFAAPKWWKLILVFWGSDQFGLTFCWSNSQISSYQWRLQFVFIRIFRTACQAIHNGHLRRWPSALQPGHHRLPNKFKKKFDCRVLQDIEGTHVIRKASRWGGIQLVMVNPACALLESRHDRQGMLLDVVYMFVWVTK